jgi:APA family basic amino acid/polyamine antiporter
VENTRASIEDERGDRPRGRHEIEFVLFPLSSFYLKSETRVSIKPKLGLFDLTMIIVSLVIGIGIFRAPSVVAQKAGSPFIFFTAWIVGGVVSICGALTFAEIGSRYPVAGGFYKIFSHCYHPAYAFMLNWSMVIINAASAVVVAIVGAEYINPLLPALLHSETGVKSTAAAVILILYALNYMGIRMGARAQNILSMVKIAMILVLCCALFGPHKPLYVGNFFGSTDGFGFIRALGLSLITIFFTYGGYQNTINFGADIRDAQRNIPRAIFAGMSTVIIIYLIINLAYYSVLGFEGVQQSKVPAADLAGAFFGPVGQSLASLAIFISVLGFINTSLMSNPRVYYAMAEDRLLPSHFKRLNEKTMTQQFALTFFVALMMISLILLGTFEKIVDYVMFIDCLAMLSAAGTIFIFRRRAARDGVVVSPEIFRLRFYPVVPLVFILAQFIIMINVLVSDTRSAMYGFTIFLVGYPLYLLMRRSLAK